MTKEQRPIIPPLELIQQWLTEFYGTNTVPGEATLNIATRAAQWGADQELEACIAFVRRGPWCSEKLRAARRPKPPSLKEQALALLEPGETRLLNREQQDIIRRALEKLPDE